MKKLSSEVKTGIVVTLTIGAVIWGFNLLKGRNLFNRDRVFYAVYKNVAGLTRNNPVYVQGMKSGQVRDVYFVNDTTHNIVVAFSVTEGSLDIPLNSVAKIVNDGFLGSKAIELQFGDVRRLANGTDTFTIMMHPRRDVRKNPYAIDGDTLIPETAPSMGDQFTAVIGPIKDRANSVLKTIDSVLVIVQDVLNKDARTSLDKSFESVKKALATLAHTANKLDDLVTSEGGKISTILSKMQSITSTVAANNDKISAVMQNLKNITDSIARSNLKTTIDNVNLTLQKTTLILDKINKGEGSMGLLVNDKKLYNDLDSTSINLKRLLDDMRLHPKRYVHFSLIGKRDKKASHTEVDDLKVKIDNMGKENEELRKEIEELKKKQ